MSKLRNLKDIKAFYNCMLPKKRHTNESYY